MTLTPFGQDIWIADGTTVSVLGFRYPTRCAVIRLKNDGLLIWSPVALTTQLKAEVDALGDVTHLIAPNHFHHLFLSEWQTAYPDAALFGLSGLRTKRSDLRFDGVLSDIADPSWAAELDQAVVANKLTPEVVFFHKPSKTVIFTDLIQQFPKGWHKGWRGLVAKLDLMTGNLPQVPRKFRLGFRDRQTARAQLAPILNWPSEQILIAHGEPVRKNGKVVLAQAFAWLMR